MSLVLSKNRIRDVGIGNRLTAARGKGNGEEWWKEGEGTVKEHV